MGRMVEPLPNSGALVVVIAILADFVGCGGPAPGIKPSVKSVSLATCRREKSSHRNVVTINARTPLKASVHDRISIDDEHHLKVIDDPSSDQCWRSPSSKFWIELPRVVTPGLTSSDVAHALLDSWRSWEDCFLETPRMQSYRHRSPFSFNFSINADGAVAEVYGDDLDTRWEMYETSANCIRLKLQRFRMPAPNPGTAPVKVSGFKLGFDLGPTDQELKALRLGFGTGHFRGGVRTLSVKNLDWPEVLIDIPNNLSMTARSARLRMEESELDLLSTCDMSMRAWKREWDTFSIRVAFQIIVEEHHPEDLSDFFRDHNPRSGCAVRVKVTGTKNREIAECISG